MATTQQGILAETGDVAANEQERRLTLPESTMMIVGSSGALWVMLYGLINFLIG